ncbi:hypothetical protein U9M48_036807 [Paspalum notatum var. saurae]|uniref:Uncharacterized protein n=1 Tax=Paspalum notatum var. saurae TaxID=547442 RepID=A0AAQ3UIC6_PASNO
MAVSARRALRASVGAFTCFRCGAGSACRSVDRSGENARDVEVVTGRIDGRYKRYMNELDCVTHRQVEWTPYYREEIEEAELSPLCRRDEDLGGLSCHSSSSSWWSTTSLHVCYASLDGGRSFPTHGPYGPVLHMKRRQGRYSETDWRITHVTHTGRWDARQ